MIVVKLMGGHSNQLFQYATGRRLADHLGVKLYMDKSWFTTIAQGDTLRTYELGQYKISQDFIASTRLALVKNLNDTSIKAKVYSYSKGLLKTRLVHYREKGHGFDPGVLKLDDNTYLEGFWQNENYFKDIRPKLLKEIELITELREEEKQVLDKIKATESISLHVRRGDYVSNPDASKFHGLTPVDYYRKAVKTIQSKLRQKSFHIFVFSNDIAWCRHNLKLDLPTTFVEGNKAGAEDMRLMKHCKHNILANSSFSWWGAWLNQNPAKVVIAPKIWFQDKQANRETQIIPEPWIRL